MLFSSHIKDSLAPKELYCQSSISEGCCFWKVHIFFANDTCPQILMRFLDLLHIRRSMNNVELTHKFKISTSSKPSPSQFLSLIVSFSFIPNPRPYFLSFQPLINLYQGKMQSICSPSRLRMVTP